jgi:hypothetical protein
MAQGPVSGFIFKDTTVFFSVFVFIPSILIYTKSMRMRSKDAFEETVVLRYKSEFWERGSEFSRAMRERMFDELSTRRSEEINEAILMEEKGLKTSSLDGASLIGDILDEKRRKTKMSETGSETKSGTETKKGNSGGFLGGLFG